MINHCALLVIRVPVNILLSLAYFIVINRLVHLL